MNVTKLFAIILFGVVAGCTTMTPEEQRLADEETCRSYGFVRKNDAFAECLQRIELDRRASRRASLQREAWIYAPPPPRVIVVDRHRR